MNNPAAKEPSMDEILSSIRQIIADEDGPAKSALPGDTSTKADPGRSADIAPGGPPSLESDADAAMLAAVPAKEPEPLALSPEQMIGEPKSQKDDLGGISFDPGAQETSLATNTGKKPQPVPEPAPVAEKAPEPEAMPEPEPEPVPEPAEEIELVVADDVAFEEIVPEQEATPVAKPASTLDADLSGEMAENLLAPTTDAAARHAFARLGALSIGGADLTLEAIVRDMLRPMLKEWLDENLPATVERMVEKEIERVSRRS